MTKHDNDAQTALKDVCQQIMQCDIRSPQTTSFRTSVYKLLLDSYDNDELRAIIQIRLCNAMNKLLISVFYSFVHNHDMSQLSTWVTLIQQVFHQFKHFYDDVMHAYIVFVQDQYVSPFMKAKHHPFCQCKEQFEALLHAYHPFIYEAMHSEIHSYVESSKKHILHQSEATKTASHKSHALLQSWLYWCSNYKLSFDMQIFKEQFIDYLTNDFGKHTIQSCASMYAFFSVLFETACQYQTLLTPKLTNDVKKKIVVEICCHYELYDHWSKASFCLFYGESTKNKNLFYWEKLLHAFQDMDVETCFQHYESMCNVHAELCKYKPFNPHARNTQFLKYVLVAIRVLGDDLETLHTYWLFIQTLINKITQESTMGGGENVFMSRLSHLCGAEFYKKVFKDENDDESILETLMTQCTRKNRSEQDIRWFITLWQHYKHKDVFLQQYLEQYVKPHIETRTINIRNEDLFLVYILNHMQGECTTQVNMYQSLIHEYHQRSFAKDTFAINKSMWQNQKNLSVQLHHHLQQILDTKTQEYNTQFPHRTIEWDMHRTWCDFEFTWNREEPRKICRIHTNLWTLNILLWIDERTTLDALLNDLLGKHDNTTKQNMILKYLNYLEEHHIVDCTQDVRLLKTASMIREINMKNIPQFDFDILEPDKQTQQQEHIYQRMTDKSQILQAKIIQQLKALYAQDIKRQMDITELFILLQTNIVSFKPTLEEVKKQLDSLEDRDYIVYSMNKTMVQYVP